MIVKPPHNRRLGVGGVSLTKQRPNKNSMRCLKDNQDQVEKILLDSDFYRTAPFYWVTIAIRYGLKNEKQPHYLKICKKYGDLPLAIEIDIQGTRHSSYNEIFYLYRIAMLRALIHAGDKFNCNTEALREALKQALSVTDYE